VAGRHRRRWGRARRRRSRSRATTGGLADGCFLTDDQTVPTPQPGGLTSEGRGDPCESRYPIYANTRIAAGQPQDLYWLKCGPEPIDWGDYPVTFTEEDKAKLRSAFPSGVCGYRRPGPQAADATWTPSAVSQVTSPSSRQVRRSRADAAARSTAAAARILAGAGADVVYSDLRGLL